MPGVTGALHPGVADRQRFPAQATAATWPRRFFALVPLLNLPLEMLPDVILLDEPELGLHPLAVDLVAEMVKGGWPAPTGRFWVRLGRDHAHAHAVDRGPDLIEPDQLVLAAQKSHTEISLQWFEKQIQALERPHDRRLFGLDDARENNGADEAKKTKPAAATAAPITDKQKGLLARLVELDRLKAEGVRLMNS